MNYQRRKVGFDLDDVVTDFYSALSDYHNVHFGTNYKKEDYQSYYVRELWGCSEEEAFKRVVHFYNSDEHLRMSPIAGALDGLRRIRKEADIIFVTSRPEHTKEITLKWINKNISGVFSEIHFLGHFHDTNNGRKRSKGEVCDELGVEIFVDDRYANARSVSEVGIPTLLFDAPWNRKYPISHPNMQRVACWDEILTHIL